MTKIGKVVVFVLATLLLTVFLLVLMHRRSLEVVAQWRQPGTIKYNDYGPCYLSVVKDDIDWSAFPFVVGRNYFIYVGHDSGSPSYGHMVKFSFHPSVDLTYDVPAFVKKSQVQWTEEGVTFLEPSGHRLFVPKEMYIRGR